MFVWCLCVENFHWSVLITYEFCFDVEFLYNCFILYVRLLYRLLLLPPFSGLPLELIFSSFLVVVLLMYHDVLGRLLGRKDCCDCLRCKGGAERLIYRLTWLVRVIKGLSHGVLGFKSKVEDFSVIYLFGKLRRGGSSLCALGWLYMLVHCRWSIHKGACYRFVFWFSCKFIGWRCLKATIGQAGICQVHLVLKACNLTSNYWIG